MATKSTHGAFCNKLRDEEAIEEAGISYELVSDQIKQLQENIELWLTGIEASEQVKSLDIRPEDSVSNVGSTREPIMSRRSSASTRSSVSSARAKAAARKAILEAEAATLQKLHQIQEEELKLRQRKDELRLETEMAKARAEESAYVQAEQRELTTYTDFPCDNSKLAQATSQIRNLGLENASSFLVVDTASRDETSKAIERDPPKNESTAVGATDPYNAHPFLDEIPLARPSTLNNNGRSFRYENPQLQQSCYNPHPTPNQGMDIRYLLQQQQDAIMVLTLPQPDLPVFSGDPIEYCDFIRAFENLIERKTTNPSTRLYYLLQYTSGQVQDLVRSCLTMREFYAELKQSRQNIYSGELGLLQYPGNALFTAQKQNVTTSRPSRAHPEGWLLRLVLIPKGDCNHLV